MLLNHASLVSLAAAVGSLAAMPASAAGASAQDQVWAAELAFANTMAQRKLEAFGGFVADEAIFFAGTRPLKGKAQVLAVWAAYFEAADAPFSWLPDQVEVLASGTLALSTGPVRDPAGAVVARFNSIWRLESDGRWRVIFDKGSPPSAGPQ